MLFVMKSSTLHFNEGETHSDKDLLEAGCDLNWRLEDENDTLTGDLTAARNRVKLLEEGHKVGMAQLQEQMAETAQLRAQLKAAHDEFAKFKTDAATKK